MKNRFYIAILVFAAVVAGCAKVDVVPASDRAVSFQVGSYAPQTKADDGPVSIITVDGITSFSSRGFLHAEGMEDVSPYYQEFFGATGETITYNGSNAWNPSHIYYWPKSANSYVNFVSWYGTSPELTYTQEESVWTASAIWNKITVAKTDNLLFADMAWRYNENTNSATYGFDGVTEGVPTLFHHALAQIRVMARATKASDTGVSWTVKLASMSVAGVNNKGTLELTNADPGAKGTQAWTIEPWTDLAGESTQLGVDYGTSPLALTTTAQEILGYSSVIPQSVEGKTFNIAFTVETKYGTTRTVEENVTAQVSLADATVTNWNMNTRITYTLAINPDTGIITIIPVETNWTDESEYPINIE